MVHSPETIVHKPITIVHSPISTRKRTVNNSFSTVKHKKWFMKEIYTKEVKIMVYEVMIMNKE